MHYTISWHLIQARIADLRQHAQLTPWPALHVVTARAAVLACALGR